MAELPEMSQFAAPRNESPERGAIRDQVTAKHFGVPQRLGLALIHLNEVFASLDALAGLGHVFSLVEGSAAVPLQYPKMLYHDQHQPRTVESSWEEAEAKREGWREEQVVVESPAAGPAAGSAEATPVPTYAAPIPVPVHAIGDPEPSDGQFPDETHTG